MSRYPFIKAMILNYLMENEEVSGYDFIKFCQERGIPASSGTVYPHLKDLTSKNLLYCKEEEKRKVYTLTEEGRERLEETSLRRVPPMIKELFFRNMSTACQMDWEKRGDVEKLLLGLKEMVSFLVDYRKEIEERSHEEL